MKKFFDLIISDIRSIEKIKHIDNRFVRFNLYDEVPLRPLFEYLNCNKNYCSKIVGLINSHFNLSHCVEDISNAIIMLGSNSINVIVLVCKIIGIFSDYIKTKKIFQLSL